MKIYILSIIVIIVLASCNKDKVQKDSSLESANLIVRIATLDEFEVFGNVHNMGLDFMADESDDLSVLSQEQRFTLSRSFSYSNWMDDDLFTSVEMIDTIIYISCLYENSNSVANDLVLDGILSSEVEDYFHRINLVFDDVLNQSKNGVILTPIVVDSLIGLIEDDILVNNLQYDASTTDGDWYACMLATTSVAKASYSYWYSSAINTNSPWNFMVNGYGEKLPIPKWLKKAVDVVRTDFAVGVIAYDLHRGAGQSGVGSLGRSIGDGFSGSATVAKPSSK